MANKEQHLANQKESLYPSILPYSENVDEVLSAYRSSPLGLNHSEALRRLDHYGRNSLPEAKSRSVLRVFVHQFGSPLIYVLLIAAMLSVAIQEWSDAGIIMAVLFINGLISTIQEYSAEQAASSLRRLVTTRCRVLREGDSYEIDGQALVPGDTISCCLNPVIVSLRTCVC